MGILDIFRRTKPIDNEEGLQVEKKTISCSLDGINGVLILKSRDSKNEMEIRFEFPEDQIFASEKGIIGKDRIRDTIGNLIKGIQEMHVTRAASPEEREIAMSQTSFYKNKIYTKIELIQITPEQFIWRLRELGLTIETQRADL